MKLFHFVWLFLFVSRVGFAQEDSLTSASPVIPPQLRPSPVALAAYKTETCYLKVTYGQPFKKGRVIFGNLEPYGKLWRTGANEATELTVTKEVRLAGKSVKPGTYTLFTIPNPDSWTIVLNSELGQWGAFQYKQDQDYLRVSVPAEKNTAIYEALTFKFNETNTGADLELMWDDVKVRIPFTLTK